MVRWDVETTPAEDKSPNRGTGEGCYFTFRKLPLFWLRRKWKYKCVLGISCYIKYFGPSDNDFLILMDSISLGVRHGKAPLYSTESGTFMGKGGMAGVSQTGRRQNVFGESCPRWLFHSLVQQLNCNSDNIDPHQHGRLRDIVLETWWPTDRKEWQDHPSSKGEWVGQDHTSFFFFLDPYFYFLKLIF